MEWIAVVFLAIACLALWGQQAEKKAKLQRDEQERHSRRERITAKYAGNSFRDDILGGTIRPGMTVEQLIDSWGLPAAVDERVLKTKIVRTYKYAQTGTRSFRQKVKVENGIVVGWSQSD